MESETTSMAAELAGIASIRADDRSTWPPELLEHAREDVGKWDPDAVDKLWQYRHRVATRIVTERLGDAYLFCMAVVDMFLDRAEPKTLEWELLDLLELWIPGLVEDAVWHALRIAPVVQAAMPYDGGVELLDAVRAKLAQAEQAK